MSYPAAILPGMSEQLPSRWHGITERIPDRLEDLRGPTHGTLALPLRLAWSGMTVFDLGDSRERLMCYQIVLTTGGRQDAEEYLNPDHLVADWSDLRRLFHRRLSGAWEATMPALASSVAHRG